MNKEEIVANQGEIHWLAWEVQTYFNNPKGVVVRSLVLQKLNTFLGNEPFRIEKMWLYSFVQANCYLCNHGYLVFFLDILVISI